MLGMLDTVGLLTLKDYTNHIPVKRGVLEVC
jgi:hypothetical protein